jgi:hypothetical protein
MDILADSQPDAAVRLMASALYDDFANGRVGTQSNTFEHRSRVLRQLAAKAHTELEE